MCGSVGSGLGQARVKVYQSINLREVTRDTTVLD